VLASPRIVAIVDDDASVRSALLGLMRAAGIPARAFASADEFLQAGAGAETACVVADVRMPGRSGLKLQAELGARWPRLPVIFITAHWDAAIQARATAAGAVCVFQKPFDDQRLLDAIREAVGQSPQRAP
jgi:FixJ family two-component response regulator